MVGVYNYYPFGQLIENRTWEKIDARNMFNSMEADNEVMGKGNLYSTPNRFNSTRDGRWLSVDPLSDKFPSLSPYMSMGCNPIVFVDPMGDLPREKDPNTPDVEGSPVYESENIYDRHGNIQREEWTAVGGKVWSNGEAISKSAWEAKVAAYVYYLPNTAKLDKEGQTIFPDGDFSDGFLNSSYFQNTLNAGMRAAYGEGDDFLPWGAVNKWSVGIVQNDHMLDAYFLFAGGIGKAGLRGAGATDIVMVTGQRHHLLSNKIMQAINNHPTLKGGFTRENPKYIYNALDKAAHQGYQTWHRQYDAIVVKWLQTHPAATTGQFNIYLHNLHQQPWLKQRIPNVNLIE